jgi:tetratricopeptide (TPR) repeat protein
MTNGRPASIGPYEVLEELGRGAHGLVYRCLDRASGEVVAIKTVQGLSADRLQILRREIHALARIRHPGIARILSQGIEEGRPWCAMELVPGEDLWEHCRRLWAPSPPVPESASGAAGALSRPCIPPQALREILTLLRRLCAPLAYLHGEGLVHRDLKPRNVLLRSGASPVLVDFGLAAEFSGPVARAVLELGGTAVGTDAYAAPEQLEGRLVDARADLYALGCMLYGLLTGRTAFERLSEVLDPELPPAAPSQYVAGLPEALDELVLGLLVKEPGARIGHADAVAAALARLGADNGGPPAPAPRPFLYRPALAGRAEPLRRLGRLLAERLRAGRGALVFVGGESGIGKTRLAVEVAGRFRREGIAVLAGECLPAGVGTRESGDAGAVPLRPLLGALQAIADRCREGGEAETERLLGPRGPVLARYEPALRDLPGHERWSEIEELPAEQARLRLFRYVAQTLAAHAEGRPMLLVLDDLHWADELSLGFLGFAARAGLFERIPLVVLGMYRSEEVGSSLQACLELEAAEVLRLDRLEAEAVGLMGADMLGLRPAPERLARSLARHTGGNPFFVAEYLRFAVEEGLLRRDLQGRWQVAGGPGGEAWEALPLPGSVRDLVARRLAGLPALAGRLVRCASVAGRQASAELLRRLAGLEEVELLEASAEAVRRQVLEDGGQGLLRFVHDQLREVAYKEIASEERPDLHRAAAEAIEAVHGGERERFLAELGQHWELAGEIGRAWECYLAAARHETARYAHAEAERLYRAALALPRQPDAESVEARRELGAEVLSIRGRNEEALAELLQALAEARRLRLTLAEARCLQSLGAVCYELGRLEESRQHNQGALALYQELGEGVREAEVLSALANVDALQGQLQKAKERHIEALELHRRLGHRSGVGATLGHLGIIAWHRGQIEEALQLIREAYGIYQALGNRRQQAIFLAHLGGIDWSQGRINESRDLQVKALELHREIGDRLWEGIALGNLGTAAWTQGRLDEARELYEQALSIHRETGDCRTQAVQMTHLACVHRDQGRLEQARQLFESALKLHREVGHRLHEEDTLVQMAILERRAGGDLDRAEAMLTEAEALSTELDDRLKLARCLCERGHLALARDRPARELLERAERQIAEAGAGPTSEYGILAGRLRRAVEASELKRQLCRGELASDLPDGFRRWLEAGGRLAES